MSKESVWGQNKDDGGMKRQKKHVQNIFDQKCSLRLNQSRPFKKKRLLYFFGASYGQHKDYVGGEALQWSQPLHLGKQPQSTTGSNRELTIYNVQQVDLVLPKIKSNNANRCVNIHRLAISSKWTERFRNNLQTFHFIFTLF